jgi:hypothetical protein
MSHNISLTNGILVLRYLSLVKHKGKWNDKILDIQEKDLLLKGPM